ncbi:MAG: ATP synthase F1 subunit gamma [Lachnospiraceae bacterium]|nr:ATP synthase F1 subunit gamma [Lachnospiraceae bacterium]
MATPRELKERIDSIGETLKITNAMYLISSTKLRKARKDLDETEPYFTAVQQMMDFTMKHLPEGYTHPFLDLREDIPDKNTRRAILCITADKGLAGSYNHNILKITEEKLRPDSNDTLFLMGEVGRHYFAGKQAHISGTFAYTIQDPTLSKARSIASFLLERYQKGQIDELFVVFTHMKNSLEMEPVVKQLLPLNHLDDTNYFKHKKKKDYQEEILLNPTPDEVIEKVVPNYLAGFIYGVMIESFCAEQSARMSAMDNANKNGKELLDDLKIQYSRVRQSQITQEITEVAAGERGTKQHE